MNFQTLAGRIASAGHDLLTSPRRIAELKVLAGSIRAEQLRQRGALADIRDAEFKVFSQFGEDGILQYLATQTALPSSLQTFVEFGVETYQESNTRFLVLNNNYRGMIIDGSARNVEKIKLSDIYWRHDITAVAAFIDRDNINDLISNSGFSGEIGILSIDIDGNDYWVWQAIDVVDPIIVVCEYNSVFGNRHAISVPYDPSFTRTRAHYSNLYWGCSLGAWAHLASRKGYALVGSNSAGNNAFFVRRDRLGALREVSHEEAWVESRFSESRDLQGNLTFLRGQSRVDMLRDLPIVEVTSGQTLKFGELA